MSNYEVQADVVQSIATLAQGAAEAQAIEVWPGKEGQAVGVVVPKTHDYKDLTKEIDERLERLAPGPRQLKADERAETLDGFIALVRRHRGTNTAIEALRMPDPTMKAYVDYHGASDGTKGPEARRLLHKIAYEFPFTEAFRSWASAGLAWNSKRDFLKFVQDRTADMVNPRETEADENSVTRREFEGVLRSRGMDKDQRKAADLEVLFGTPEQLIAGARAMGAISAEEYDEVEAGLGEVSISYKKADKTTNAEKVREFYLVEVSVFEGEAPQVLPARLRAMVEKGQLFLRLELIGLKELVRKSFEAACAKVASETACPVYRVKLG